MNAAGGYLSPAMIFPRKRVIEGLMNDAPHNLSVLSARADGQIQILF